MPIFLTQISYNENAWKSLIENPQDRTNTLKPVVQKLGGSVVKSWFAFGEHDQILISELPDPIAAAALGIAISAAGDCRLVKTTPLMENSEALEAVKKAAATGYRAASAAPGR